MLYNHDYLNNNSTYTYSYTVKYKYRWTLSFHVRMVLLTSDFGSWQHKERDTILTILTPSQYLAHLVMSKISAGRDLQNSNYIFNSPNSTVCLHGPISTLNWLFFKILKFSGPSLPGMTSSTLLPHFLSGGLWWQWWLSYPFRVSVKLHPMTMHLNS